MSCPPPGGSASGCSACETRNSKAATDLLPGGHAFYGPIAVRRSASNCEWFQTQANKHRASLCLSALIPRRQHASMPLLVLGMSIAEPPAAFRAMHGRGIIARLIIRRDRLTQSLHIRALVFHFSTDASRRHSLLDRH